MISTSPLPLPKEDPKVGEVLLQILVSEGVAFQGGYKVEEAHEEGDEKVLVARNEAGETVEVRGEEVLIAPPDAPPQRGA